MQCPKCNGMAFRILPETVHATEVECLTCGHVSPFYVAVKTPSRETDAAKSRPSTE
jgi:uncharacterized Zn finger protein